MEWFGKITDWIDGTQLFFGANDAFASLENFIAVAFSDASGQEKWDAFYDAASQVKDYISPTMNAAMKRRGGDADDTKPVSYTHLDVYKRQGVG